MRLEWCNHSYFLLRGEGKLIAIDPHDGGSINLGTCRVESDVVLVTHNHYDHNAVSFARGPKTVEVLWRPGLRRVSGIEVEGVRVFHDKQGGRARGEVIAYVARVEGLRIAHLGDLGHMLSREQAEALMEPDILMIPVGGIYTITPMEAWRTIRDLNPRIAIPMHYWVPGSLLPLEPLERFLNVVKAPRMRIEGSSLELTRQDLPERTTIIVFRAPSG